MCDSPYQDLKIATCPFAIKISGGVANLRPAFTVEIKGLAVGILSRLLLK